MEHVTRQYGTPGRERETFGTRKVPGLTQRVMTPHLVFAHACLKQAKMEIPSAHPSTSVSSSKGSTFCAPLCLSAIHFKQEIFANAVVSVNIAGISTHERPTTGTNGPWMASNSIRVIIQSLTLTLRCDSKLCRTAHAKCENLFLDFSAHLRHRILP